MKLNRMLMGVVLALFAGVSNAEAQTCKTPKCRIIVDTVILTDTIEVPVDTVWDTVTITRVDTVPRVCPICPSPTPPPDTTTPPPPPPPTGTNEPSGFTRLSQTEPKAIPPYPSSGGWWSYPSPDSKLSSIADASAPSGDGSAWVISIPSGVMSGAGLTKFGPTRPSGSYKKMYVRHWIRMEGSSFEGEVSYTKLGFWGYGNATGAHNEGIFGLSGSGTKGLKKQCWRYEFRQQGPSTRNIATNGELCAGAPWSKLEVLVELNTLGNANGRLTIWKDGQVILDKRDMVYIKPGYEAGFKGWMWNFVWGGNNAYTKSQSDKIRVDGIYISGQL